MKNPVQKEIDQIDNVERKEIQRRIDALGYPVNRIVQESWLTSLPNYLGGGKMHTGTMFVLKRTLNRLEAEQAS